MNNQARLTATVYAQTQVIVFSKLSGVWVGVHEFGATNDTARGDTADNKNNEKDDVPVRPPVVSPGDRHNTKAGANRSACAAGVSPPKAAGDRAASDRTGLSDTRYYEKQTPTAMPASDSATESKEGDPDGESKGAAGSDERREPFVHTREGRRGGRDEEEIDWAAGVPVAARFVTFKVGKIRRYSYFRISSGATGGSVEFRVPHGLTNDKRPSSWNAWKAWDYDVWGACMGPSFEILYLCSIAVRAALQTLSFCSMSWPTYCMVW